MASFKNAVSGRLVLKTGQVLSEGEMLDPSLLGLADDYVSFLHSKGFIDPSEEKKSPASKKRGPKKKFAEVTETVI